MATDPSERCRERRTRRDSVRGGAAAAAAAAAAGPVAGASAGGGTVPTQSPTTTVDGLGEVGGPDGRSNRGLDETTRLRLRGDLCARKKSRQ